MSGVDRGYTERHRYFLEIQKTRRVRKIGRLGGVGPDMVFRYVDSGIMQIRWGLKS
jgi:hypothetical protein